MSTYPVLTLKPERDVSVAARHPWVFSGALEKFDQPLEAGQLVHVADHDGVIVGTGAYSKHSMIAVRIFAFGDTEISRGWLQDRIRQAENRRRLLGFGPGTQTTGYRVVFGESDYLPGLVLDRYNDVFVIQLTTAGMDNFRDDIRDIVLELFEPRAIYERSDHSARNDEGLKPVTQALHGSIDGPVGFLEHGRKCLADVTDGQKTGFFLDLRDLRQEISRLSDGRRVADLFSNSGAGGLAALMGGASSVHFVDSSERALDLCGRHVELNDISRENVRTIKDDVFQWLADKDEPEYDMVLLDPPALIKSRRHYETGRKGYHFLNRAAMRVLNDGGILASSSCSSFFSEDDLAVTLRRAADQAGVTLSLLKTVRQSPDHPLSVYFPESLYLKSFVCQIHR